jgi:hypothetical protein
MKSITSRILSHVFTFDFDLVKISVSIGQVLTALGGTLALFGLFFAIFTKFGGTTTLLPTIIIIIGLFGLLVMKVWNKGVIPRSKIGATLQEFASEKDRTRVEPLYTGITPTEDGLLQFEDGRIGKLYLVDGILSKTTMVAPLEISAQAREANYIGREDDVQEDNHTLVSTMNKKEAVKLIYDGVEAERIARNNNHSLFFKPFMDLQQDMMKLSNTSILNQYMILSADTWDSLINEESALSSSGSLTAMIEITNPFEITQILRQTGFFAK